MQKFFWDLITPWTPIWAWVSCSIIFISCTLEEKHLPLAEKFDKKTQPFAFVLPQLPVVEGTSGLKASDCGACHQQIYQEWKGSTHAHSLSDLQFQAELAKPGSPQWLCLNCHIPIQNQRRHITTHLKGGDVLKPVQVENPGFDPALQKEGITCATCHVRVDKKTGKSFIYGPEGSAAAPHPVKKGKAQLQNICMRCHDPKGEAVTPNLICWFETQAEMLAGRKSNQPDVSHGEVVDSTGKSSRQTSCVECHMPEQIRIVAETHSHLPPVVVNRHLWTGSGIPKEYTGYDDLLYREYHSALNVVVESPKIFSNGDSLSVHLTLSNKTNGHSLPTADPERFIQVRVEILDVKDSILHRETYRIGQKWDWNPARKLDDNRLGPGEVRRKKFSLPQLSSATVLRVQALHVRLTSANARHMQQSKNIREDLAPGAGERLQEMGKNYPMANYVFREDITLSDNKYRVYSQVELIGLSQGEQEKDLTQRGY